MKIIIVVATALATLLMAAPANAEKIVVVGDSIVYGVGATNPDTDAWPTRIGARKVGKSGGCVITVCHGNAPMVDVYDQAVLSLGPDVVVISYGINDIAAGQYSAHAIVQGLGELVERARARGARPYVTTILPVGSKYHGMLDAARRDINSRIRGRFPNVIDWDPFMMDPDNGLLRWRFNSGDGLHPNSLGYERMADAARAQMREV